MKFRRIIVFLTQLVFTIVLCCALDCHKYGPGEGTWLRNPPFWREQDCPTNFLFDANSTQQCLAGRTVYIIGISTARQFGFSIRTMLGGGYVSREQQKQLCTKTANQVADSCHETFRDVSIKDLFFHYLDGWDYSTRGGFTYVNAPDTGHYNNVNEARQLYGEDDLYPEDSCSGGSHPFPSVRDCLEKFFEKSQPEDVLILNVGLMYSVVSAHVNGSAWLRASAVEFQKNVVSLFKGSHVLRVPITQTYAAQFQDDHHQAGNQVLAEVFGEVKRPPAEGQPPGIDKPKKGHQSWYVLPQWQINKGRHQLYQDFIHFAGPLTDASIYQMLGILCPQYGRDPHIPALPLNDELVHRFAVDRQLGHEYLIDPAGYLHALPAALNSSDTEAASPAMLSTAKSLDALRVRAGVVHLSEHQLSFLPLAAEPLRSMFADRTLVRQHDMKQVYVVYGGRRFAVTLNDFFTQGYEFADVIAVLPWELNLLADGGNFSPSVIGS